VKLFTRTDRSAIGRWWWTVDRPMLATLLGIIVFGVALVMAASPPVAERIGLNQYHFIVRHLAILVPTLIALFGFSMMDLRKLRRGAFIVLGLGLVAMVMVLFVGMEIKGATRWLHLPGFSLQPSEFVKPAFLVVAAWFISRQKEQPDFPGMKIAVGLFGVVLLLLVLQPDMGMSVVTTACFMAIIFLAGLPMRWVILLMGVAGAGGFMAYTFLPHVQSRVDRFLNPEVGDTYQIDRSLEAFRMGGLFGAGPGQGTVKLTLPDAHADFIFSVAGEELGLIFLVIIIALYGYVLVRGFNRIMDSDDMFVVLATGGLADHVRASGVH
jgi:cell division protein FtsW